MAKGVSWKLWIAERQYPTAPCFSFLNEVPGWVHWLLLATSVVALAALIRKFSKPLLVLLLICEICACLLDQTRWQPWEYQYLFTMFIFLVNYKEQWRIQPVLIFLLATIYIYSGLHKMSGAFIGMIWKPMILTKFFRLPQTVIHLPVVHYSGYILPVIEFAAGIFLLIPKTRRIAAKLLIAMHLYLLLLLGPLGININVIIWPWNTLMIVYLYLMVIRNEPPPSLKPVFYKFNYVVVIFWAIMPAFCFVGLWDNYLSSNLYSGNVPSLIISVKDKAGLEDLAPYFAKHDAQNLLDSDEVIYLQNWAFGELNVPAYPELRTHKIIVRKFMKKYRGVSARFFVYRYPYNRGTLTEIKPGEY